MLDILYFLLLFIYFLIGFSFYKNNLLNSINFFSIHYIMLMILAVIGTFAAYVGFFDDSYYFLPISGKKEVILISINLILWSSVGLFLPILILNKVFKTKLFDSPFYQYNREYPSSRLYIKIFIIFYFFCSIIYIIQSHPSVPYLVFTNADLLSIANRRYEFIENYWGSGIIKTISINFSYILIFFIGYKNYFIKVVRIFLLLYAIFILLIMGEKAPIIFAALYYLAGYLLKCRKKLNIRVLLFTTITAYIIYYFQFSIYDDVAGRFFSRIFLAQNISVFLSVDQFMLGRDLIGFDSLRSGVLQLLFGVDKPVEAASYQYVDIYYPGMRSLGTVNVNGIYIHEALANFGLFIAILSPIFLGLFYYIILSFLRRNNHLFISLVVYYYFSLRFISILTSFNLAIFNLETIMTILLLIFIYIISIKIKGKNYAI